MHEDSSHYAENTMEELGQASSRLWSAPMPVCLCASLPLNVAQSQKFSKLTLKTFDAH